VYFRQTNFIFKQKNRNLDKQTAPFSPIKHQRDKQIIFFAHPADIQLFKLYNLINIPPRPRGSLPLMDSQARFPRLIHTHRLRLQSR